MALNFRPVMMSYYLDATKTLTTIITTGMIIAVSVLMHRHFTGGFMTGNSA